MPEDDWESAYDLLSVLGATLTPVPHGVRAFHADGLLRAFGARLSGDLRRMAAEAWDEGEDEGEDLLASLQRLESFGPSVGEESGESPAPDEDGAGPAESLSRRRSPPLARRGRAAANARDLGRTKVPARQASPSASGPGGAAGSCRSEPALSCEGSGTNGSVLAASSGRTTRTAAVTSSFTAHSASTGRHLSNLSHIRMRSVD